MARFDYLRSSDDCSFENECTLDKQCPKHCDYCKLWFVREQQLVMGSTMSDREFDKQYTYVSDGFAKCPVHGYKKSHKGANGRPKGVFAGTLTMSPDDDLNQNDMIVAIKKVLNYKQSNVKRYAWYLELTKAGLPHIHFIYETNTSGRIKAQLFTRAWSKWDENKPCGLGHRGGYHKNCASTEDYKNYIKKDGSEFHEDKW